MEQNFKMSKWRWKLVTRLINDIRNSLDNKCYFAALSLALALPDICGVAKLGENSSVAKRYIT